MPAGARADRLLALIIAGLAALVHLSWAFLVVVHLDDRYHVDHVGGAWMALAKYASAGELYPPLYDGESFGGTRYMPLQVLLHAALSRLTGEYLVSGKLLVTAFSLALLATVYWLLRASGCSRTVAAGLLSVLLVTATGLVTTTSMSSDMLALLLQLVGVALVARSRAKAALLGASALFALALATKLSAVWGPAAVAVWLLFERRRDLPLFATSYLVSTVALLSTFEFLTHGRFVENLRVLSLAGFLGPGSVLVHGSARFVELMQLHAPSVWVLVPFVVLAIVLQLRSRRPTLMQLAFVFALAVVVVVVTDFGAYYNHLIDVAVLSLLVIGDLHARSTRASGSFAVLGTAILVGLAWTIATSYQTTMRRDVKQAVVVLAGGEPNPYRSNAVRAAVSPNDRLLSEDPYVPVMLGQFPVVLDSFMLLRLLDENPDWRRRLVARIDAREFDKIILGHELDVESDWWKNIHFGETVIRSIARNYRLSVRVPNGAVDYRIYVPRR